MTEKEFVDKLEELGLFLYDPGAMNFYHQVLDERKNILVTFSKLFEYDIKTSFTKFLELDSSLQKKIYDLVVEYVGTPTDIRWKQRSDKILYRK